MLIGVGASTCASGSQVWTGTAGSFTRKPTMSSPNNHFAPVPADPSRAAASLACAAGWASATRSNDPPYR